MHASQFMRFISLTNGQSPVYLAADELLFLKSNGTQTEIFLKNRSTPLTVDESLTEVLRKVKDLQRLTGNGAQPLASLK